MFFLEKYFCFQIRAQIRTPHRRISIRTNFGKDIFVISQENPNLDGHYTFSLYGLITT